MRAISSTRAGVSLTKMPTRRTPRAVGISAARSRSDVPRAGQAEIEADRVGAGIDGRRRVIRVGNAANFDDHAAISSRNASAGRPDFIRCSPTRNALYPAARRVAISLAVWMPLSLIRSAAAGICSARRSEVSSDTSKVTRSRLFTPIMSVLYLALPSVFQTQNWILSIALNAAGKRDCGRRNAQCGPPRSLLQGLSNVKWK